VVQTNGNDIVRAEGEGNISFNTLASSTTKTGRHDIAEILLKGGVKHNKSINSMHKHNIY
jgi:hypothetical protein